MQQQIAQMKHSAGIGDSKKDAADSRKAAADAAINSVLFQEARTKKELAREALAKAAAKAEKAEKSNEPDKKDIYIDSRDAKKHETMEDWDDEKLAAVVKSKAGGQGQRCPTDILCKHFLDAVEKRQYGWFWECPNGGDKCQYRHALPEGYVLKRDRDLWKPTDEKPKLEDEIEERRKVLTTRTPVTFERLQAWLMVKQDAKAAAEAAEFESLRSKYAKTGKASGVTGKMLFSIDSSLFVDDAAANDVHYTREESDEEEESSIAASSSGGAPVSAAVPTPLPLPTALPVCSSADEPGYTANYQATTSGRTTSAGAGESVVPDLEGVDESLFLDDDLPDDDEIG